MEKTTKKSEIKRNWHLIDAKDKILGRLATGVVPLLIGKNKPYFVHNLDCGDHVVIINSKYVKFTGRKLEQKQYDSYSGYPAGRKIRTLSQLMQNSPEKVILSAVSGMLPDNKLKRLWLGKLYIFPESEHQFEKKFIKNENMAKDSEKKVPVKKLSTKHSETEEDK